MNQVRKLSENCQVFVRSFSTRITQHFDRAFLIYFSLILMGVSLAYSFPIGAQGCASANHHAVAEYCYRLKFTATSANPTLLTNYPVRVPLDTSALVSQGIFRKEASDIRGVNLSLQTREVMAQDMASTTAGWWVQMSTIPSGGSTSGWIYFGNKFVARDQAFSFYGNDSIAITDHTNYEPTDNFEIRFKASSWDALQSNGEIIDKATGNYGYKIEYDAGFLKATYGDGTSLAVATTTWDGTEGTYSVKFSNTSTPKLGFLKNVSGTWTPEGNGSNSITSVAHTGTVNVVIGDNLYAHLHELELRTVAPATKIFHFGFNAQEIDETTKAVYNSTMCCDYGGTVKAIVGNNPSNPSEALTGAYSMRRRSDNIAISLGAISPIFEQIAETVTAPVVSNLGTPFQTDIFTKNPVSANVPFLSIIETQRASMGFPSDPFWILVLGSMGAVMAVGVYYFSRRAEFALVPIGVAYGTGATMGLIAPYIAFIYGVGALAFWLISKWGEE